MATSINDLVKFEPQIAGHDRLLRFSTNDLIVIKPCTESEHRFYEDAQKYPDFSNWLPECYGTLRAPTEHELKVLKQEGQVEAVTNLTSTLQEQRAFDSENKPLNEHLCIENVLYGFKRPCIMDVKIGYQLYEDNADPAKKEKMIKNAQGTTIETMGVRISGMKTYDPVNSTWTVYNKSYGRSRTKDDLIEAFLAYFFPTSKYAGAAESYCTTLKDKGQQEENDDNTVRKPIAPKKMRWILECLIDDVQAIRNFVAEHPALQLIGSSLLFVYEGDRKASDDTWEKMLDEDRRAKDDTNDPGEKEKEEDEEEENTRKLYDIRAIDFSHSKWDAKRTQQDPKLVKALDNLLHLLQSCLERQKQEKLNTTIS